MAAMQKQSVVGKDVPFERIRRLSRVTWWAPWTNGTTPKKAEERDRVKHL